MTPRSRSSALLLCLGVAVGLLSARSGADALPAAKAPVEVIDRILAVVGDDVVTETELERRARPYLAQAEKRMAVTTDAPTRAATAKAIRDDVFEKILDERAIQSEADEMQITVSPEDIDRALDSVAAAQGVSRDALLKAAAESGMTLDAYRAELRTQLVEGKLLQIQVVPSLRPGLTGEALNEELAKARPPWIRDLRAAIYIEDRRGR